MKKSLHPAAVAAAIAVLVVAFGALFVKFGSGEVHGVSMAEAMKTTTGNKVNSFTGEPLTPTQVEAAARQDAQVAAMKGTHMPGTAANFGGRTD